MLGKALNPCTRRAAMAAAVALLATRPSRAQTPAPGAPFMLGTDQVEGVYTDHWMRRTFAEAFRRLDVPLQIVRYPLQRLSVMLQQGSIDGEMLRARGYAAAHPTLVRVEEPVFDVGFALYVANPAHNLKRLDELASTTMNGIYRRGVLFCEGALKAAMPPDRLADITDTPQGLQMLLAGRADFLCDVDAAVLNALYSSEFKGVTTIRKMLDVGTAMPLYSYLHPKHAALAPRLAATFRQMKAEGLVERYRLEALRQLGR
jgi:polar amino acid transport system substrate-binding protein